MILEPDYQVLKDLIGKYISYAVLPDLVISNAHYSCLTTLGHDSNNGPFYHSSPISFYITDGSWKNNFWIALDAGPDDAEEPWAPFAAWKINAPITTCLFGEINLPGDVILEEQENDKRPTRMHLWSGFPINKIIIYKIGEYAAMSCFHTDGIVWSAYAEYDRKFWLSFDKKVFNAFENECDDCIIIT